MTRSIFCRRSPPSPPRPRHVQPRPVPSRRSLWRVRCRHRCCHHRHPCSPGRIAGARGHHAVAGSHERDSRDGKSVARSGYRQSVLMQDRLSVSHRPAHRRGSDAHDCRISRDCGARPREPEARTAVGCRRVSSCRTLPQFHSDLSGVTAWGPVVSTAGPQRGIGTSATKKTDCISTDGLVAPTDVLVRWGVAFALGELPRRVALSVAPGARVSDVTRTIVATALNPWRRATGSNP